MTKQTLEFKTEVKQILDLMIHSIYTNREIFLRELVSNASDAIDKLRFEALTHRDLLDGNSDWKIKIEADREAGTITVSDNGIGMNKEDIVRELGTIAHSGTREFLKAIQSRELQEQPELIGQFGVGFYSSFMVADRVTVLTRKAGEPEDAGVKWESTGDGTFSIENLDRKSRGTDIILHLKEQERKFLDEAEIRRIIKKYSDFTEHPIVMDVEKERPSVIDKDKMVKVREEEVLNSRKAVWLKDKSELSESDYNEFYRHISYDFSDPARTIHFRAEGTSEFSALLYIPETAPFDIYHPEFKIGPMLYVKRVQIMDHCDQLIPPYLRFVKGVVDSSDLPLNISRETLQNNPQVALIKKNITKKILRALEDMKKQEYENYVKFYGEFGKILKEGIHFDPVRKEALADLLLFESTDTKPGEYTSLSQYADRMKEDQKEIYYVTGPSRTEIERSPYLEAFREKGYEVLIMTDQVDDLIMGDLLEYNGKKLKSVIKGDIDLKPEGRDQETAGKQFKDLLEFIREHLKDEIKDVRFSGRLKEAPCCLVAEEGDMDIQMEKLLKSMGQKIPEARRILEINPGHRIVDAMDSLFRKDRQDPLLREYIDLLYGQALLMEGSSPKDPAAFSKSVARLMADNALGEEKIQPESR
ncbi:MAG TPA: molecular chaperone HtpG [Thermodesulfobacteriaceae bacterium]|nr:molecular chaperone HtpG [Thermodesulfobacteriaceae bacterium]